MRVTDRPARDPSGAAVDAFSVRVTPNFRGPGHFGRDPGTRLMRSGVFKRVFIFAPRGRDEAIATAMLADAGIAGEACASLAALVADLRGGAGLALVTKEALHTADLRPLAKFLGEQAEWSDFPWLLLTECGGGLERNPAADRDLDVLGKNTFLERPFHPTTLVSLA